MKGLPLYFRIYHSFENMSRLKFPIYTVSRRQARTSGSNWRCFLTFKSTFLGLFEFKGYQWHDLGLVLTNVWYMTYPNKHCCLSKRYVLLNYTDGLIWHNAIREKSAKERKIERVSKERDYIRRIEYFPAIYPYFGSGFIPSLCEVTYKGNSIAD